MSLLRMASASSALLATRQMIDGSMALTASQKISLSSKSSSTLRIVIGKNGVSQFDEKVSCMIFCYRKLFSLSASTREQQPAATSATDNPFTDQLECFLNPVPPICSNNLKAQESRTEGLLVLAGFQPFEDVFLRTEPFGRP